MTRLSTTNGRAPMPDDFTLPGAFVQGVRSENERILQILLMFGPLNGYSEAELRKLIKPQF